MAGCGTRTPEAAHPTPAHQASQIPAPIAKPVQASITITGAPSAVRAITAAVLQSIPAGHSRIYNQQAMAYPKADDTRLTLQVSVPPGRYQLGVFTPLAGYRRTLKISAAHHFFDWPLGQPLVPRTTTLDGTVTDQGHTVSHALVMALPTASTRAQSVTAITSGRGAYHLALPGQGMYTVLAVIPGVSGVAVGAVDTLDGSPATMSLRLPKVNAPNRLSAALLQSGWAYTPTGMISLWGYAFHVKNVTLQVQAIPGANHPVYTTTIPVHRGRFHWKGQPWPRDFEDLTATVILRAPSGQLLWTATTPGVPANPSGTNSSSKNLQTLDWATLATGKGPSDTFATGSSSGLTVNPWSYGGMAMHAVHGMVVLPLASPTPWNTNPLVNPKEVTGRLLTPLSESEFVNSVRNFAPPVDAYLNGLYLAPPDSGQD